MAKKDEAPGAGHNSAGSADQLKSVVERIERLEEEKKSYTDDIKEVYAKANGYDIKILRKVIARRKRDRNEIKEEEAILDLYEGQLGIFG